MLFVLSAGGRESWPSAAAGGSCPVLNMETSPLPPERALPLAQPFLCRHGHEPSSLHASSMHRHADARSSLWLIWLRKYVILCLVCGGSAVFVGVLFIAIYFTLKSYTSSLQFFETIPTYVPAAVLILTGLMVMCFAKRRNRYTYLVKFAGGCCLTCVLLCVVITVTTTVVHMNRLQTLHKCDYSSKDRACMCLSAIAESPAQDGEHQFVFNDTPSCEVVHGSLYGCLRALFGLSVVGILVCIFSSMLVYQLLSHERKKVYLEQLELRRRLLYRRHPNHGLCACYGDMCHPWPLWDMLDYRLLAPHQQGSHDRPSPEELISVAGPSRSRTAALRRRRPSLWWLPWTRRGTRSSSSRPGCNAVERLLVRDGWRCSSPAELVGPPGSSPSPWRNGCTHGGGSRTAEARGVSSRSAAAAVRAAHRRTRSNDGVFHHLQMNTRYGPQAFPDPPCSYTEIPAYLWGPPPPYSQPPSLEDVACLGGENSPPEASHCSVAEGALQGEGCSSKRSTPSAERHVVVTIGGDFPEVHCRATTTARDGKHRTTGSSSFIVEVPCFLHKGGLVFHTLPARSRRKRQPSPFKSLSNIPLCISRRLSLLRHENIRNGGSLAFLRGRKASALEWPEENTIISELGHTIRVICEKPPKQTSIEESSNNATETATPTVVTLPLETSQLAPTTEPSWVPAASVKVLAPVHAHSMPNLSITASSGSLRVSHHNEEEDDEETWTSRDFADTGSDGSQLSDATSAPSIPDEEEYVYEGESSQASAVPPPLPPKCLTWGERRQRYVVLSKRQGLPPLSMARDPVTFLLETGSCCACPSQPQARAVAPPPETTSGSTAWGTEARWLNRRFCSDDVENESLNVSRC